VTHVADVAVKRASVKEILIPSGVEAGSVRRSVPAAITSANENASVIAGFFEN